jgi:hypothetical protein
MTDRVVRLISRANLLPERAKEECKPPRPALRLGRATVPQAIAGSRTLE